MKAVSKFVEYYVFGLYFLAVAIFSCLSGGDEGKEKRMALLVLAGLVLAAIFKPAIFFTLIILYLLLVLVFIIFVFWTDKQYEDHIESKARSGDKTEERTGYRSGDKAGEKSGSESNERAGRYGNRP